MTEEEQEGDNGSLLEKKRFIAILRDGSDGLAWDFHN